MTAPFVPNEITLTVTAFKVNKDTSELVITGTTNGGAETFRLAVPLSKPLTTRPV